MLLPTEKTKPKVDLQDYSVLIHGRPKIGKSTWGSHADDALFLAFEPGLNALEVYQMPVDSWQHFCDILKEITEGKHPFKTIVVDTVDIAYRMCADFVCKKFNVIHQSDLAYGKGPSLVNNEFHRVLGKLAKLPYGLILVSHTKEITIETRTGEYTKYVPSLSDGARKGVVGMVDMILYCDLEASTDHEGKQTVSRVIRTKPSQCYEAGDRTQRLPEVLPLDYPTFRKAFISGGKKASESPKPPEQPTQQTRTSQPKK